MHLGSIIGFTDLGEINAHLSAFEQQLENGTTIQEPPLAKTMLVLMVRGLFSGLQFPYAQFACLSITAVQMFHVFWKAVARLERIGLKVLGLTCDGLSANRRLFRLHGPKGSKEIIYKVANPYSPDGRKIFFFSDPPHLIKTIRNFFANRTRHLWVNNYVVIMRMHLIFIHYTVP